MEKRNGEEMEPRDLQELEDIPDIKAPLTNKAGAENKAKKKTDDLAEEPDVDPGIDYMRWSE